MEDERSIDWTQDPYGRRGQIERQFWAAEDFCKRINSQYREALNSVKQYELDSKWREDACASAAYQSLEAVVRILLTLETNVKLSKADGSILATVDHSVEKFKALCESGRANTDGLGAKASEFMSLGDNAARVVRDLESRAGVLMIDATSIWSAKMNSDRDGDTYRQREGTLRDQVRNAENERGNGGNQFLALFSEDIENRLNNNVSNAQNRLNENLNHQFNAMRKSECLYQLSLVARNSSAALWALRDSVFASSNGYDVEFKRILDSQAAEAKLWNGVIRLKNTIWDVEYRSTRDNSLRRLIQLLTMDNEVFLRQELYESTERRIRLEIHNKLGEEALRQLEVPAENQRIEEFELP